MPRTQLTDEQIQDENEKLFLEGDPWFEQRRNFPWFFDLLWLQNPAKNGIKLKSIQVKILH